MISGSALSTELRRRLFGKKKRLHQELSKAVEQVKKDLFEQKVLASMKKADLWISVNGATELAGPNDRPLSRFEIKQAEFFLSTGRFWKKRNHFPLVVRLLYGTAKLPRSHNMAEKAKVKSWREQDGAYASLTFSHPHARAIDRGTPPKVITSNSASPFAKLFFFWQKEGKFMITSKVNHPGIAPRHYVQSIKDDAYQALLIEVTYVITEIWNDR